MAFSSHQDAKLAGWFSRRHRSADAHLAVREANAARFEAKFADALSRQAASDKLTPFERVKRLDARLGKGRGATREREKLAAKV